MEKTNLNIESWLFSWGIMYGHLHDGIIESTKFTILYWLTAFCLTIFSSCKWIICLFISQDSLTANLLGDWTYVYGPRLFLNLIQLFCEIFILYIFIIFYFSLKHPKKMLFWLEQMEFDKVNRCFSKLKFDESDSTAFTRTFTRRMSLLRIIYNSFVYFVIFLYAISANISIFKRKKAYYLNYVISIVMYCPQLYINLSCVYGFLLVFYQVNKYQINFI